MTTFEDEFEDNRHLILSPEERNRIVSRDSSVLPLNARLMWEVIRPHFEQGRLNRILEGPYFACAETALCSFLSEDECAPYYVPLREWITGEPAEIQGQLGFRRMACHEPGLVYVYECPGEGCVIGFTKSPDANAAVSRHRGNGRTLTERLVIRGDGATKQILCAILADKRLATGHGGAWFGLKEKEITKLARLCAPELLDS